MNVSLNRFAHALAALAVAWAWGAGPVAAQSWPQKPIKIIVPYTPGGASDITARILADRMSSKFGQPVTVDNRAGASGTIGTDAVAKAAPDGYTLALSPARTWSTKRFSPICRMNRSKALHRFRKRPMCNW